MSRRKDNPSRWRVWPKERKTKRAAVKPDAEALELVRRKDCRNLEITGCYGECRKGYLGIVRPDDFCSRAENLRTFRGWCTAKTPEPIRTRTIFAAVGKRRRRSERGNELHSDKEMNE